MSEVYLRLAPREFKQVGGIDPETGQVYRLDGDARILLGRVDFADGKVYEQTVYGEEILVGWTVPRGGAIFRPGEEVPEYLGHVELNGKVNRYNYLGRDRNLGRLENMTHVAEGGAAFLLLLDPLDPGPEK